MTSVRNIGIHEVKGYQVNILLWVLQVVFGLWFIMTGVMHFTVPDGLPAMMAWMYDLNPTMHLISGGAEILGGLGLILPGLTRIQTRLTPLAAAGLTLVMLGAIVFHIPRGEFMNIGMNVFLAVVFGFIAYGRWKLAPLSDRGAAAT